MAEQYIDRDALALVQCLNYSELQRGLLRRVPTIGDNALELTRHIEGMGHDPHATRFAEVVDRIQALPEAYQQAPLESLLKQCSQGKYLPDPKQLCALATLVASRSIEKVDELSKALNALLFKLDSPSRTDFLLRFLSVAMKAGQKSELSNGSDYSTAFLRVLAILTHDKRRGICSYVADAPGNFYFLPIMVTLKDMQGRMSDKLEVLSFLLMMTPRLCEKQYQVVFEILATLSPKEHASARNLVFEAIFWRIDETTGDLRSRVARAYIKLVSPFDPKERERSLHLMFLAESAWNREELTSPFFDALRQFNLSLEDMIVRTVSKVIHDTRARRLLEEFVRYIRHESIDTQEMMLTGLLNREDYVRRKGNICRINENYLTPLKNGLAALKP